MDYPKEVPRSKGYEKRILGGELDNLKARKTRTIDDQSTEWEHVVD